MNKISVLMVPVLMILSLAFAVPLVATPAQAGLAETLDGIDALVNEVSRAQEALRDVEQSGDQAGIFQARQDLERKENSLEDARINTIADEAGISRNRVREMRSSGMGWGKIAKDLGVHPSVVGMGNGNAQKMNKAQKKNKSKNKGKKGYEDDDDATFYPYDADTAKGKGKGKSGGKGKGKK